MAKILIVDDDHETATLLTGIVQANGHEAVSVNDSKNAISSAEDYHPDLILLDIMMAEINGIMLCKLIKSNPLLSNVPVMMVSALSDEGTKRDSANAGASGFVSKPIRMKDFAQQIDTVLAG